MGERYIGVDRIVGGDEEQQEELKGKLQERFDDPDLETLREKEKLKSNEETQAIYMAHEKLYATRKRLGLPYLHIPLHNIHIIKKEHWDSDRFAGIYKAKKMGIYVCEDESITALAAIIYHEMLHFHSYGAIQINDEGEAEPYRVGMAMKGKSLPGGYFRIVNEAVTKEMEKEYINEGMESGAFGIEGEQTMKLISEHPDDKKADGSPLMNDDVYVAWKSKNRDGSERVLTREFGYQKNDRH